MQNIVFLTGAGISKESGLETFRDKNGHWNCHDVMEVASLEAWENDPEKVLDFYNQRRIEANKAKPNKAHLAIAEFGGTIITQNVDLLHEKAGSTDVLHLHGKINEAYPYNQPDKVFEHNEDILLGNKKEGNQIRPNVVWFGEDVPNMIPAIEKISNADILVIIGTSLQVYPAANLIDFVDDIVYLDPSEIPEAFQNRNITHFKKTACEGIDEVLKMLK